MSEKKFDFSIVMDDDEKSIPDDIWGEIPIKEDRDQKPLRFYFSLVDL